MKNMFLFLMLFFTQLVNAQTVFKPTSLIIGKGTDVDMSYLVDRNSSDKPMLKWDGVQFKWYFSNDGLTFGEMVSKSYVDAAVAAATIPDADATTKGKLQLAGDLSGTASSPTVPGLTLKAPLASPTFTGVPAAPTATPLTNSTQIATTAYVDAAVTSSTAPDATTISKGILQLAGDLAGTAALPTVPGLALKAPIASPTFTGVPAAPTATGGTNTTQIATTAFVTSAVASSTAPDATTGSKGIVQLAGDLAGTAALPTVPGLAGKQSTLVNSAGLAAALSDETGTGLSVFSASPALTGSPTAPTQTALDNSTKVATTAYVDAADAGKVSGPASATDNAISRFDTTSGKLIQNSNATISDTGTLVIAEDVNVTGNINMTNTASTASLSGIQITNNNILSGSGANLDLQASSGNGITFKSKTQHQSVNSNQSTNDAASGANQTLTAPTKMFVRLTAAGTLTSIDMIPAGAGFQQLTVVNATGAPVTLNNLTGGTAANQILTGQQGPVIIPIDASFEVAYDLTSTKWRLIGVGGGAGLASLSTIFQLIGYEVPSWSTGDNATFLGGGTISGTFAADTTTPMHGFSSYKYTQAAGSLDDYFVSPAQAVDRRFRGSKVTLSLPYTYDGANNDIQVVVYDATNSVILDQSSYIQANSTSNFSHLLSVYIPPTTASIRVGFQTKVLNSGKIFAFDDVQMGSLIENILAYTSNVTEQFPCTITGTWTNTTYTAKCQRRFDKLRVDFRLLVNSATVGAAVLALNMPSGYVIDQAKAQMNSADGSLLGDMTMQDISTQAYGAKVTYGTTSQVIFSFYEPSGSGVGYDNFVSVYPFVPATNDFGYGYFEVPIVGWSAANPNFLSTPEVFSTDTANCTYSSTYTTSTLANAPIGTYIWFSHTSGSDTATQVTTGASPSTVCGPDGILMYARARNVNATSAQTPAKLMIQIGQKQKGTTLGIFKSSGKTTEGSSDVVSVSTSEFGMEWSYSESTGILTLNPGYNFNSATTSKNFFFSDGTTQSTAYVTVNASKNPALTGINVPNVYARGVNSSTQSFPNGTATVVVFDSAKTYDNTGGLNTASGVFTASEPGVYSVKSAFLFTSAAWTNGNTIDIYLNKNAGVFAYCGRTVTGAVTTNIAASCSDSVYLNKGDTISISINQGRGSATTLINDGMWNHVAIEKVSI